MSSCVLSLTSEATEETAFFAAAVAVSNMIITLLIPTTRFRLTLPRGRFPYKRCYACAARNY